MTVNRLDARRVANRRTDGVGRRCRFPSRPRARCSSARAGSRSTHMRRPDERGALVRQAGAARRADDGRGGREPVVAVHAGPTRRRPRGLSGAWRAARPSGFAAPVPVPNFAGWPPDRPPSGPGFGMHRKRPSVGRRSSVWLVRDASEFGKMGCSQARLRRPALFSASSLPGAAAIVDRRRVARRLARYRRTGWLCDAGTLVCFTS